MGAMGRKVAAALATATSQSRGGVCVPPATAWAKLEQKPLRMPATSGEPEPAQWLPHITTTVLVLCSASLFVGGERPPQEILAWQTANGLL